MDDTFNNRILVVDDNKAIHEDFKKVLLIENNPSASSLSNFENTLLGSDSKKIEFPTFVIDSAYQGQEALQLIEAANKAGKPYALVFVDIRMPPGWDGVETIEQVWKVDANIQTVICTAFSDYSWEYLYEHLGYTDRLLILKKPFDNMEIRLMAISLTRKWQLNKLAGLKQEELQQLVDKKTFELSVSLSLIEATLESTADGILVIDKENKIARFNKKFQQMWGLPESATVSTTAENLAKLMATQCSDHIDFLMGVDLLKKQNMFGSFTTFQLKDEKYIEQYILPQLHAQDIVGVVYSFRDITQAKLLEVQLGKQATYDNLTGLPNRVLLIDRLQQAIEFAKRNNSFIGVLFIDLDSFKAVNDTLGHEVGDELLRIFSDRLKAVLRSTDTISRLNPNTVARLGGDEFVIILPTSEPEELVFAPLIQRILGLLTESYTLANHEFSLSLSIGVSLYPKDGDNPTTLIKCADAAMYAAKESGKGTVKFYAPSMSVATLLQLEIEPQLRHALERNEFTISYQPLVDVVTQNIMSMEALVRWISPTLGTITPVQFLPVADATGLILPIGEWILRTACAQNKAWQVSGVPPMKISVNLSAFQFKQKGIVEQVKKVLEETGLEAKYLSLELTEAMILNDVEDVTAKILALKELGIVINVDDFGTGYSNLSYMKQFPIDKIKIDPSFIQSLSTNPESRAIVESMLIMAKNLHIGVIAEGVETSEQFDILRKVLAEEAQGFYFSQPLSVDEATKLLNNHKPLPSNK